MEQEEEGEGVTGRFGFATQTASCQHVVVFLTSGEEGNPRCQLEPSSIPWQLRVHCHLLQQVRLSAGKDQQQWGANLQLQERQEEAPPNQTYCFHYLKAV